jgi:hypothetical protein
MMLKATGSYAYVPLTHSIVSCARVEGQPQQNHRAIYCTVERAAVAKACSTARLAAPLAQGV